MIRVLASDEIGYVRALERSAAAAAGEDDDQLLHLTAKFGALDRSRAVISMRHVVDVSVNASEASRAVVLARKGGTVEFADARSGTRSRVGFSLAGQMIFDAHAWTTISGADATHAVVCGSSGNVSSHAWDGSAGGDGAWRETSTFRAMENATSSDFDANFGRLVIGGRGQGCDVMIYDVAEGKRTFKAKYPKANWLGYTAPPWVSAACYAATSECARFFVGTGEHKFRHYDTRADERAVLELDVGEGVITSVASAPDGMDAYVANARGTFEIIDLRAGRARGRFKGNSGSIRGLAVHPDGELIACAGLDQYVRVYDARTRKCLASAFAKQPLTSVVFDTYTPAIEAAASKKEKKKKKKSREASSDDDERERIEAKKEKKKKKKKLSVDDDGADAEPTKKKKKKRPKVIFD